MEHVLDSTDLDNIRELRALPGYSLVFIRTTDEIKRLQIKLEHPQTEQDSNILRGELAGLRLSLEIPQILEDEANANVTNAKEKRRGA